jgi:transcriptional regulator of arginine metabolism
VAEGPLRLAKPQRQLRIARLLADHGVSSQGQLVELLREEGLVATQATVSRDLEELGAVKVRVPGGDTVYAIPELAFERVAPEDNLRRVLSDWVAEIGASGNLVVLRTPPGSAHVVGSALDRAGVAGVLGTVAGDDTVLVVATAHDGGAAVARRLCELAGIEPTSGDGRR